MNDATIKAAMDFAARGWKVVPLYGVDGNGKCSCRKPECSAAGKHPCCGDNWLGFACNQTEDDISQWGDRFKGERNLGLVLGPAGGIIDIECDTPEADEELKRIVGDDTEQLVTPTYGSSRGKHRLFKWSPELPNKQKEDISGLEIRIGNGGASTQSVAPPSRHHTGAQYSWIPGLSPDDVEVAEVPPAIVALLQTLNGKNGEKKPANAIIDTPAMKGDRCNALLRFAVLQAMKIRRPTATEQRHCAMVVSAVNSRFCVPPLDDAQVEGIIKSAVGYRLRQSECDLATVEGEIVESQDSGEAIPEGGGMTLTIVAVDPVEYSLHCPAWKKWNGTGSVHLTHKEIYNAEQLPEVIARQIPQVCLETYPGSFSGVWAGLPASKKNAAVEGLLSILIRDAVENGRIIKGSAFGHRTRELLWYVVEALERASPCGQEGTPDENGDATKMPDGSIWLIWMECAREIVASRKLADGTMRDIRRAVEAVLGEDGLRTSQHRYNGVRRLYTKFSPEQVQSLRDAAFSGIEEGGDIQPRRMEPAAVEAAVEPNKLFEDGPEDWGTEHSDPFA